MFMCDVAELTDWCWEELTAKEIIQWEETELCSKHNWGIGRTTRVAETVHNEVNAISLPWQCGWNGEIWKKYSVLRLHCCAVKELLEMCGFYGQIYGEGGGGGGVGGEGTSRFKYFLLHSCRNWTHSIYCFYPDDLICVSNFCSSLSTAINWIILEKI